MSAAATVMQEQVHGNGIARKRRQELVAFGLAMLAGAIAYWPTFAEMSRTWVSTDTYLHGFVIIPIAAVLVWRLREQVAALPWRAAPAGLAVLLLLSVLWLAGARADISVVQQLAVTAMLPALVYTIAGGRVVRLLAFPLAYLIFAVPMGDGLVPWLMQFTADFTVKALELTGIPVFREGLLFSTSRGDFAVEKACSGVRYLIASVAVGVLYAYLTYRSPLRRALFIALSALVPIVANGVRAYLIVVLAHASDMQIAVGIDHIIYGWIFFGVVMLGLFAAGQWFREAPAPAGRYTRASTSSAQDSAQIAPAGRTALLTALAIAVFAAGPIANLAFSATAPAIGGTPMLARIAGDWNGPLTATSAWHPAYAKFDLQLVGRYEQSSRSPVDVALVYYSGSGEGDLGTAGNRVADPTAWRELQSGRERIELASGRPVELRSSSLRSHEGRRIAWWLYVIDDTYTASAYALKWREALAKLAGRHRGAALLAVSAAYEDDPGPATAALAEFLGAHLDELTACAATGGRPVNACDQRGSP